jgi:hypothetical protein
MDTGRAGNSITAKNKRVSKISVSRGDVAGSEWTYDVFRRSIGRCERFWIDPVTQLPVLLTPAHQLVGAHNAITRFRKAYPEAYGRVVKAGISVRRAWESLHIVEEQDLKVLRSLGHDLPDYEVCPAVLIPPEAHRGRVNRTLGRGASREVADLESYAGVYATIGNYTGMGERPIRKELVAISRTILMR